MKKLITFIIMLSLLACFSIASTHYEIRINCSDGSVQDTFISEANANTNYANESYITVGTVAGDEMNAYLNFSFANRLPVGYDNLTANLTITLLSYVNSTGKTIYARNTTDLLYSINLTTWNNHVTMGAAISTASPLITQNVTSKFGGIEIMMNSSIANSSTYFLIAIDALYATASNYSRTFYSCEAGFPQYAPTIILNFDVQEAVTETRAKGNYTCEAPVGMNLNEITDYNTGWYFVDMMKTLRIWSRGDDWNKVINVSQDAQGYPLYIPDDSGQSARSIWAHDWAHYPAGNYSFSYEGKGNVSLSCPTTTYYRCNGGVCSWNVSLNASCTSLTMIMTASSVDEPVHNMHLLMPGFNMTNVDDYHPQYLEGLKNASIVRFMKSARIDNQGLNVTVWDDRTPADYYTQAATTGIAPEFIANISYRLDTDIWVCIPYMASDAYIANYSVFLRDHVNPDSQIYVEYSNEIWNGGTYWWMKRWINFTGLALGFNDTSDWKIYQKYNAKRSAEIFEIFDDTFSGYETRIVKVLGGQSSNLGIGTGVMGYFNSTQVDGVDVNPNNVTADAYAIAPYIEGGVLNNTETYAQVFEKLTEYVDDDIVADITGNLANAAKYNLSLISYEGGQSVLVTHYDDYMEVQRENDMNTLYDHYIDIWSTYLPYKPMVLFSYVFAGNSFGALEHQDNLTTPKYIAYREAVDTCELASSGGNDSTVPYVSIAPMSINLTNTTIYWNITLSELSNISGTYGSGTSYNNTGTFSNSTLATIARFNITGLSNNTKYNFNITMMCDSSANCNTTGYLFNFTTSATPVPAEAPAATTTTEHRFKSRALTIIIETYSNLKTKFFGSVEIVGNLTFGGKTIASFDEINLSGGTTGYNTSQQIWDNVINSSFIFHYNTSWITSNQNHLYNTSAEIFKNIANGSFLYNYNATWSKNFTHVNYSLICIGAVCIDAWSDVNVTGSSSTNGTDIWLNNLNVTLGFSLGNKTIYSFDQINLTGSSSSTANVTASANITDNVLIKGDGGDKGIQKTNITVDDNNNVEDMGDLEVKTIKLYGDGTEEQFIHNFSKVATVDAVKLGQSGFLWVSGKYVYQTALGQDTLNIIDISNPETPQIVGQLTNDTYLNQSEGIIVVGKYAFITSIVSDSLCAIDVSTPSNPFMASCLYDTTNLNGAEFVTVSGHYAFVAAYAGARFTVVDISDPLNMVVAGSLYDATNLNGIIYIAVKENFAYATGSGTKRINVINITNPESPTLADSLALNGSGTVAVRGGYAYVTGYLNNRSFYVVNVTNPKDINLVGTLTDTTHLHSPLTVELGGDYAYVATYGNTEPGIAVIDITNPVSPTLAKKITHTDFEGLDDIHISGGYAYVSDNTGGKLHIIKLPGIKTQTIETGNIFTDRLDVNNDALFDGNVYVRSGMTVGSRGIFSLGDISTSTRFCIGLACIDSWADVNITSTTTINNTDINASNLYSQNTFSVNNSALFVDSNKVGIGTATPTRRLEISDSTKAITISPEEMTINATNQQNITISAKYVIFRLGT